MTKSTMMLAITTLAAILLFEVMAWAALGFILWNWNITTWNAECRFDFVMMSAMVPAAILVVAGEVWVEMKFRDSKVERVEL